jgi:hypothetical protein
VGADEQSPDCDQDCLSEENLANEPVENERCERSRKRGDRMLAGEGRVVRPAAAAS